MLLILVIFSRKLFHVLRACIVSRLPGIVVLAPQSSVHSSMVENLLAPPRQPLYANSLQVFELESKYTFVTNSSQGPASKRCLQTSETNNYFIYILFVIH